MKVRRRFMELSLTTWAWCYLAFAIGGILGATGGAILYAVLSSGDCGSC